jgi:hypothetical protein
VCKSELIVVMNAGHPGPSFDRRRREKRILTLFLGWRLSRSSSGGIYARQIIHSAASIPIPTSTTLQTSQLLDRLIIDGHEKFEKR